MKSKLARASLVLILVSVFTLPAVGADHSFNKSDKNFAKEAATSGAMEVKLGEVSQEKANSPDVKAFGARMVQDHSKANQELQALLQTKHEKMPSHMESKFESGMTQLTKLSGGEFDKKYMTAMVKDHATDVSLFQHAGTVVKDADLKAWADKTLPVLQDHLKQSKEIAQKVGVDVNAAEQEGKKEAEKKLKSM